MDWAHATTATTATTTGTACIDIVSLAYQHRAATAETALLALRTN